MDYDAVTIDTNMFDRNQLNLEGGMLRQLYQFKEGLTQFVLSEIVLREVHRHLTLRAQRAKDGLSTAIQKSSESGLLSAKAISDLTAIHRASIAPREAAKELLRVFITNAGCEMISADQADMKRLISMYFGSVAPFEESEKKKYEFPDAIALITLEDWAKKNKKKVLAISGDSGWAKFAETCDWIDVENDLAPALQRLQKDAEHARTVVAGLLEEMQGGRAPELMRKLETEIEQQVSDLSPEPDGSSGYYFDGELTSMAFQEMQLLQEDDEEFDFYIVQIGKNKIVARVGIGVKAKAEAHFRFYTRDEGEYMPMGDCDAEAEVEFDAGALVTFEGDFSKRPPECDLSEVELVDAIKSIDFGEVEIDWSGDGY